MIKIELLEHSLTSHPLRPITSHFCLAPPPPPLTPRQSGRHICITPNDQKISNGFDIDFENIVQSRRSRPNITSFLPKIECF